MYFKRSGLVFGFHGCEKSVRDNVLTKRNESLKKSENDYDWLGNGAYFWENDYERAVQWANTQHQLGKIKEPAVLGAIIDLGCCLDLMDSTWFTYIKDGYKVLEKILKEQHIPMLKNEQIANGAYLKRMLDCAVIESTIHLIEGAKTNLIPKIDTVRGVFIEGNRLYYGGEIKAPIFMAAFSFLSSPPRALPYCFDPNNGSSTHYPDRFSWST